MFYDILFALSLVANIFLLLCLRGSRGYVDALYGDIADLAVENHQLTVLVRQLMADHRKAEDAKDYPDFADQPLN